MCSPADGGAETPCLQAYDEFYSGTGLGLRATTRKQGPPIAHFLAGDTKVSRARSSEGGESRSVSAAAPNIDHTNLSRRSDSQFRPNKVPLLFYTPLALFTTLMVFLWCSIGIA